MKLLALLFLVFLTACKPAQEATDFNTLLSVPEAIDGEFTTKEDTPIKVSYSSSSIDKSNSQDLEIIITQKPVNGILSDCQFSSDKTDFECQYTPNQDYYGEDYFRIRYEDGDLTSDKSALIKISILPVADAPTATDGSQFGDYYAPIKINLPKAIDSDSLPIDLSYTIEQVSEGGTLTDCVLNNGNRSCTLNIVNNFRGSIFIKYYVTDETLLKSNTATYEVLSSTKRGVKTFTQGIAELKKADIVWVIDNSRSMADEQETLKLNLSSFIDNFIEANGKTKFPFKMGVITTDTYKRSSGTSSFEMDTSGNPFQLTSQEAEKNFIKFKNSFQKAVEPGIDGSGDELVLTSMQRSLQLDSGWYGGNDTLLVYIILTDEREQSFSMPIENWLSYFFKLKNESFKVKFYPIINLAGDVGNRFKMLSEKTNTKLSDITKNFDSILDAIGKDVDQAINSYHIGGNNILIQDNTVRVSIDGIDQPAGWKFTNDKVIIDEPPQPGSVIKVTFEYK